MSTGRRARTPTNAHEQAVLMSYIRRFFAFEDRSPARVALVREIRAQISTGDRIWTERSIRLWFNNNRRRYLPMLEPVPPPPIFAPFPWGYVPYGPGPVYIYPPRDFLEPMMPPGEPHYPRPQEEPREMALAVHYLPALVVRK